MFAQTRKAGSTQYRLQRTAAGDALITVERKNVAGHPQAAPLLPSAAGKRSSPTGYEWGYAGSGPFSAAHSILSDFLDFEAPRSVAMEFKFKVIAAMRPEGRIIHGSEIAALLDERCGDRELLELVYSDAIRYVMEYEESDATMKETWERDMNAALELVNSLAQAATGDPCPGVTDAIQNAADSVFNLRREARYGDESFDQDSIVEFEAAELVAGLLQLDQFVEVYGEPSAAAPRGTILGIPIENADHSVG